MKINKWGGLVSTASPYILPPGGAVEQTNITSMVPGQLSVRAGMRKLFSYGKRFLELWGYSVGPNQTDTILAYEADGSISSIKGSGTGFAATAGISKHFNPSQPVAFSQGRRGEVYIYQGYGTRGLVRSPSGKLRPVGLQAPSSKPEITVNTDLRYYVARIDITDVGNGYNLPPAVSIGPPTNGNPRLDSDARSNPADIFPTQSRQAKAVCRITQGQVSEVEVTDGGAGYTQTPLVKFTDQPGVPVTGKGAKARLRLKGGPAGDYKTGVVYWKLWSVTSNWSMPWCDGKGGQHRQWRDGLIIPACGGSGTGASMYLEFTPYGKWWFGIGTRGENNLPSANCGITYPTRCDVVKPPGEDEDIPFDNLFQDIQVFDFGSGYKPGEEVYAYVQTTTQLAWGWTGAPLINCTNYPKGCPGILKGYVYGSADCPDDQTCTDASPDRQAPLDPVLAEPGSGYLQPPVFYTTDGDKIDTEIDDEGKIVKLIVADPNKKYLFPPQVVDEDGGGVRTARGLAIMRPVLRGTYQCYYRFVNDSVPEVEGGPLYSNLSPVEEVKCGDGASAMTWTVGDLADGATSIELWRTSSDQATTLFFVAKLDKTNTFVDALSDYDLTNPERKGFLAMPILLADGSLNANRFGVPPTNFAVGVVFQDRAWLAVDTGGTKPNTLMYSEADEPEAIPEVNELILQTNVRDTDYITALIPYAGALIVTQSRHCHRLSFVNTPSVDATTNLIAYRGCLNQRCWDLFQGIAYILDDFGLYSLDQQGNVEALSLGLDSMFRENNDESLQEIDFNKRKWFIVRADRALGLIRAHVAFKGDSGTYPTRQIVYSPQTKTFWLEEYPEQFSAAADLRASDGQIIQIHGSDDGLYRLGVGLTDEGKPVNYSYKSGNFEFVTDGQARNGAQQQSRQISVVYKPTQQDCRLNLSLYYNGSKTPRANVARRDRGVGFIHDDEVPAAYVNLKILPHQEAETNGVARALFAGRTLEDFSGNDTHVAIQLWGQQTNAGPVVVHSVDLMGVNEKGE